jgi:hypothetical protein
MANPPVVVLGATFNSKVGGKLFEDLDLSGFSLGGGSFIADFVKNSSLAKADWTSEATDDGLDIDPTSPCFACGVKGGSIKGCSQVVDQCAQGESVEEILTKSNSMVTPQMLRTAARSNSMLGFGTGLPDTHLVTVKVSVYCDMPASGDLDNCSNTTILKAAVRDLLQAAIPVNLPLAVSSDTLPSEFYDLGIVDERLRRRKLPPAEFGDCQATHPYNVYISAADDDNGAKLVTLWKDLEENPGPLLDALWVATDRFTPTTAEENATSTLNTDYCTLEVMVKKTSVYPSPERQKGYRPAARTGKAPTIQLGAAHEVSPPDTLVQGEVYAVYLRNFPPKSNVVIQLLDQAGNPARQSYKFKNFEDDGDDELMWEVPEDLPLARYYFKASLANNPALMAYSLGFDVVAPEE